MISYPKRRGGGRDDAGIIFHPLLITASASVRN